MAAEAQLLHLQMKHFDDEVGTRVLWAPTPAVVDYLNAAGYSPENIQPDPGSFDWIDRRQGDHNWIFFQADRMDPVAKSVIEELAPEDVFLVAEIAEREVIARAWVTEGLMREILVDKDYNFAAPFRRNDERMIAKKSLDALEIFPEQRIQNLHPDTLRDALRLRGLRAQDIRSQAMTSQERERFSFPDEEDYLRGNIFRDPLYVDICQKLLQHHGMTSPDSGHVWLTSKGIWSQHIALEAIALSEREANIVFVGKPYFEVNSRPGRINNLFGLDLSSSIARAQDEEELQKVLQDNRKPMIIYCDPLESYPSCGVRDVEAIIVSAQQYENRTKQKCYVIFDTTTCAGMFPRFQQLEEKLGTLPNIIAAQSLLKYWEWGADLTQIGAIVVGGPDAAINGPLYNTIMKYYYFVHGDPDIGSLAEVPPIRSDYMQFRADRISRNLRLVTGLLGKHFENKVVDGFAVNSHLQSQTRNGLIESIGFSGPYFFIECPSGEAAGRIITTLEQAPHESLGGIGVGVSFGFDHTRAWRVGTTRFIRVSVGTEDVLTTYVLAKRLLDAVMKSK